MKRVGRGEFRGRIAAGMQSRSGEWWPDVVSVIESKRESRPTQREEYVLLCTGRATTTSYSHRE